MPLRQPASPLSLETISPSPPDLDSDPVIASDDDLDEGDRAARDQRIEKLAQAYCHGTPLFILSASLRGPFDNGWTNPWRKDRQKTGGHIRTGGKHLEHPERPIIPETVPQKRPLYRESLGISRSKSAVPLSDPSYSTKKRESQGGTTGEPSSKRPRDSRGRTSSSNNTPKPVALHKRTIETSGHSDALTPFQHTEQSWLKRDRAEINFRKVDPPTSPTTTISSRYREGGHYTIQVPGTDYRVTTKNLIRASTGSRDETTFDSRVPDSVKAQLTSRHPGVRPEMEDLENSICVLSSTSHLSKFEFRRRKRSADPEHSTTSPVPVHADNEQISHQTTAVEDSRVSSQPAPVPPTTTSMQAIEADVHMTEDNPHNPNVSDCPGTVDHPGNSQSRKVSSTTTAEGVNISDKYPSAQRVPVNPALAENVTSLQTISAAKPNSECDNDTIPDPQFNTQAALLHAQKSFQNDLESQVPNPGETHNQPSSPANDITPFHRMNTSRVGKYSRARPPGTAHMPMSTQCIIDAVTPFTFSTEKKARSRFISPQMPSSSRMDRGTATPNTGSPLSSEPEDEDEDEEDEDEDPTILPLKSPAAQQQTPDDTQQGSALPMALSNSHPTTIQDGQGVAPGPDSFNLSQAIADAGSWLQQSFDINHEIQQYKSSAKSRPSSSAGISRSAVTLDR
ncbi:hypothetical protein BO85DRAFT_307557 [Aspergillus piperis CBS 112811]|uniref:Uncharacterized protein n=1 Tax=Aspergillus piperis CBS 112811 TaxID=1448313 RepID=A0A8G1R4K2_9EURO|nr:hypothetical protein BO85DRAFT_307557 [Aspergillus piperis CBS 112811]RAH57630.1 hypothetical protein BO85DRAFT_307557 [Aspergillus piperis CBS 112811]